MVEIREEILNIISRNFVVSFVKTN